MELLTFCISVASFVVVVAGGFFLRSYLPSYFTEKGKNLASKEDIAQITRLVESVKAQYVAEVEKVKATLVSEGQVVERRRRVYEEVCGSLRVFIAGHISSQAAKNAFIQHTQQLGSGAPIPCLFPSIAFLSCRYRLLLRRDQWNNRS